jgi:hypothetical protein
MPRLIDWMLGRQGADQVTRTVRPFLPTPAQRLRQFEAREDIDAGLSAGLFSNRPSCPTCGSVRTATLTVLRPEPPGRWTAQRRCRACGHDWEEEQDV